MTCQEFAKKYGKDNATVYEYCIKGILKAEKELTKTKAGMRYVYNIFENEENKKIGEKLKKENETCKPHWKGAIRAYTHPVREKKNNLDI